MGNPFRTKYVSEPAYKKVKVIDLRCLKDGSLRRFVDDGPFENVPDWMNKTAQSGRSALLAALAKREPDPTQPNDPDATVPVFVLDADQPVPKIWDKRLTRMVSPERMTEHYKKAMALFCEQRNSIELKAAEAFRQKQAEAEAKADGSAHALVAAFERIANKGAPKQAKAAAVPS